MNLLLRDMPIFVEAVKQKSFTRASEMLDIPLSTVSRRIIALEKNLGMPLFYRSAGKIELTDSGKLLFDRCKFIVDEADNAYEAIVQNIKSPSGPVRVSMSADMYNSYLTGTLSSFAAQWPGIQLHIHLSSRWVDLFSEPYDLDLRVGPLPDSDLKVRKLTTLRPRMYASNKLLEFYAAPKKPADLTTVPCISFAQAGEVWELSKGKQVEKVRIKPVHVVNSVSVSLELVLAGLGIGWFVAPMVAKYEKAGELVRILPDWGNPDVDINAVMATSQLPQRVRLFLDYLVQTFAEYSIYPKE